MKTYQLILLKILLASDEEIVKKFDLMSKKEIDGCIITSFCALSIIVIVSYLIINGYIAVIT